MKINFIPLANNIIALAKSFSVEQPATGTVCSNTKNKNQYKDDPAGAGSFSFLYGGQTDFLLKRNYKSTFNSQLTTHNS